MFKSKLNEKKIKKKTNIYDYSLIIQKCSSYVQEIQKLYIHIIHICNINKNIRPHDILITAYDINPYIPYIKQVFHSSINKYIKINDTTKEKKIKQKIIFTIKNLLKIKYNRFQYSWVLSLLDSKLLRKKFSIKSSDIPLLYKIISDLNIQFGFDQNHFKKMSLPNIHTISWSYAINRIISGFWMNNEISLKNHVPAYNLSSYHNNLLLGNFIDLIIKLNELRKKISYKKLLKNWSNIISIIINNFFEIPDKYKKFFFVLKNKWKKIILEGSTCQYPYKISIDVLLEKFFKKNNLLFQDIQFMSGNINIINLKNITGIPFKVVCVIGCNQNISNVRKKENIFNFPNYIFTENYETTLFEQIMSTKKYLFFSYSNQTRNGKKQYPSKDLQDILFYIKKKFIFFYKIYLKNKNQLNNSCIKYKKQKKFSKNKKTKKINNKIVNKSIQIIELINFWKNPINYFFKNILNINIFENLANQHSEEEQFSTHPLNQFKINKKILKLIILKKKRNKLFKKNKQMNKLPHGKIGKILWAQEEKKMCLLAERIDNLRNSPKKININIKIKKYQLYGKIKEINKLGLVNWCVNKIKYTHIIAMWIKHIIYCAYHKPKKSILLGIDNSKIEFSPLTKLKAKKYLRKYIQGYLDGNKKPILILKSGLIWLKHIYIKKNNTFKESIKDNKIAQKNFLQIWHGNLFYKGEKENILIQKLLPVMNKRKMKKICNTVKYWLSPILKYSNIKKYHLI